MKKFAVTALVATCLSPSRVWACAVCFGAKGDPQTQSLNMAILTLLGVTYTLFAAMIGAGFVLWRRARKLAAVEATGETLDARHG